MPGIKPSHMPEDASGCKRWLERSQPLKSPITDTWRALGAHTAKWTPGVCAVGYDTGPEFLVELEVTALVEEIKVIRGKHGKTVADGQSAGIGSRVLIGRHVDLLSYRVCQLPGSPSSCVNPAQGNTDPVRAVVQFVGQLVDRLFQKQRTQQNAQLVAAAGNEPVCSRFLQIAFKKFRTHPALPELGPVRHRLSGLGPGSILLAAEQGEMGGILERTQHPGNVAQGRTLDPPFRDGPGRFALEIDDDKIASCEKYLSEMVIAVTADAHGADFGFEQCFETAQQSPFRF